MPKETKARLKQRKQNSIIAIIVLSLIFVAATTTLIVAFVEWHHDKELKAEFKNRPEQTVQAEVASKRIIKDSFYGKHSSIDIYIYVISFKFPDDSIKELQVDRQSYRWPPKNDPDSVQYDSLTVGDIGILTYKEIENIEERVQNENVRYGSRLFISFEKDPEYGGLKIVVPEEKEETVWDVILGLAFTVALFFAVILGMRMFIRLRQQQKPPK